MKIAGFIAVLLVIGAVTLWPVSTFIPTPRFCVFCGSLGGVDFTLNIALFVPLGVSATWLTRRWPVATLIGFGVSLTIELLQWHLIPGRDATLGDLVANTAGTILGAWVAVAGVRWLGATGQQALRLAAGLALLVSGILIASALLLRPGMPRGSQFVQWMPVRTNTMPFPGRVMSAELNGRTLQRFEEIEASWLEEHATHELRIRIQVEGPSAATERRAHIIRTANGPVEGLVFSQRGEDLLFRTNTLAAQLRFRSLLVRLEKGLPVAPQAMLEGTSNPRLIAVRSSRGRGDSAGMDLRRTVGYGWTLVAPREVAVDNTWWPVNAMWLGALMFPVGFFTRRSGLARGNRVHPIALWMPAWLVLMAFVAASVMVGLSPPGPGEILGLLLGASAPWWIQRFAGSDHLTNLSDRTIELIEE